MTAAPRGFDPFTPDALADPYPQLAWFRTHDPVHRSEKLRSWVLFRHDDVGELLRDDVQMSSGARHARSAGTHDGARIRTVASDPPDHTPVRAMLTASLNACVRVVGPRIDALIAILLDHLAGAVERVVERADLAGEVDLIAEFAYPLPINVIAELLGVPEPERPQLQAWSRAIARGMDRFYSGDEAGHGLREVGAYFLQLVHERRGTAGDDLVRRLLGTDHHGDRLTDLEVVALATALVFGGHETTVNLLGSGMLAMLRQPAELARLRADPSLVGSAVEELLRFDSPAQLVSRIAIADGELRGRQIRAGDVLLAALGAANRDPEVFADPDRLDLGRTPNPHVAFGTGRHVCPGAQLSRLEARAAIGALLRRFPRIALGHAPAVHRPTAVLRGLERLPLRLG